MGFASAWNRSATSSQASTPVLTAVSQLTATSSGPQVVGSMQEVPVNSHMGRPAIDAVHSSSSSMARQMSIALSHAQPSSDSVT